MLDQAFGQVYTKFKLHFYKQIFSRFEDREGTDHRPVQPHDESVHPQRRL